MTLTTDDLTLHLKWINDEPGGVRIVRTNADLSDADLHGANLIGANLIGANLSLADLTNADLSDADLHKADLHGADLSEANIDYSCWPLGYSARLRLLDEYNSLTAVVLASGRADLLKNYPLPSNPAITEIKTIITHLRSAYLKSIDGSLLDTARAALEVKE